MSKPIAKFVNKNSNQVIPNPSHKLADPLSALREARPVVTQEDSNNVIASYKDLNQPFKDLANVHRKNLFIGFFVFLILGIGIMMGQSIGKSRNVAAANMTNLIPKGATATTTQHEHFDKICYKGENGEQVCVTRTSEQR